MNKLLIELYYRFSVGEMLLWGVLFTAFWLVCAVFINKTECGQTKWNWINRLALIFAVFMILYCTVFNREAGAHDSRPIPFYSFFIAGKNTEGYREAVANVLLFVPYGLSLPFALKHPLLLKNGKPRQPVLTSIITAAVFSAAIEISQYVFKLGHFETDDIIFNTAGAAFGTLAFAMYTRFFVHESSQIP